MGQNISAFCSFQPCNKPTSNEQVRWKSYFISECTDLINTCSWSGYLLPFAEDLINEPLIEHILEIKQLKQAYINILNQKNRCSSYNNQIGLQTDENIQSHKRTDSKPYASALFSQKGEEENDPKRLTFSQNGRSSFNSRMTISSQIYLDNIQYKKEKTQFTQESKEEIVARMNYFNQLTKLIQRQLKEKQNQLCQLIDLFFQFMVSLKDASVAGPDKPFSEVQQFSRVICQTALIYYDLNLNKHLNDSSSFYMNDEDMLYFFVSQVMSEDVVYRILFENLMFTMNNQVQASMKLMDELQDTTTQQCDINQALRLDIATYYYIKHKYPQQVTKEFQPIRPYKDSIKQLQKIILKHSSSSKIKCIIKAQESILQSIHNFYRSYGIEFDGCLDSDNMISIQIYILIKAQVLDMEVHIKLIEKFATNKVINGTAGYYLTSIQAACQYLKQIDRK